MSKELTRLRANVVRCADNVAASIGNFTNALDDLLTHTMHQRRPPWLSHRALYDELIMLRHQPEALTMAIDSLSLRLEAEPEPAVEAAEPQ